MSACSSVRAGAVGPCVAWRADGGGRRTFGCLRHVVELSLVLTDMADEAVTTAAVRVVEIVLDRDRRCHPDGEDKIELPCLRREPAGQNASEAALTD